MQARTFSSRFFRLSDEPQIPFFPLGFLGLLLLIGTILYGLTFFAKEGIEKNVSESVSGILTSKGFDWINVDVDGQNVSLYGIGSKTEGDKAVALVEQATGYTWLGARKSPIVVTGEFDQKVIPETVAATAAKTDLAAPKWGRIVAQLKGRTLTLRGLVSSLERARQIETSIKSNNHYDHISEIVNRLEVSPDVLNEGTQELESRLTESIPYCISGKISSIEGVLSVNCQVRREDVTIAESVANTSLQHSKIGEINIDATDDCNKTLKDTLSDRKILFSISSAVLKELSSALLDEIAQLLMSCPRNILVEGHTDDTGNPDFNVSLSQERAKSVVDALISRGVVPERISSIGFGPTRPLEVGTSREIRAKNRRIEIRLVDTGAN